MSLWLRALILWLLVVLVGNAWLAMLSPVLVPGILLFAGTKDRAVLKRLLQERSTKIGLAIWVGIAIVSLFVGWYQGGIDGFGLFLALLFVASWPCARYLAEKLPRFPFQPSKARPDLLTSPAIQQVVKTRCAYQPPSVYGGEVDKAAIYLSTDDRAVVIGPPGTGKTAFLITQLLEWAEQGLPLVVNDIKPEIHAIVHRRLKQAGYKIITYNPTNGDGHRYNPFADVESIESMGELIAAFVPHLQEDNKIFSDTARDLLDGIVAHLQTKHETISLPLVRDFLSDCHDHEVLLTKLGQSTDQDARHLAKSLGLSANNQRFLGSVMATLNANLRFLRYPKVRESVSQSDFSLFECCKPNAKVALFLQFEEVHQEITSLLFSAMLSHLLRFFIEHTHRPPVLLLLDEIGNVPPVTGLVKKLNTIRSRQLPTWLYFQSKEQMQRYGNKANEGASMILGACDFQMVFRLNDNETAEWMSRKIGTVDRLNTTVNLTGLLERHVSRSLTREPIMFAHELQQLPEGQAIACYRGLAWCNQAVPYYQRWVEYKRQPLMPYPHHSFTREPEERPAETS